MQSMTTADNSQLLAIAVNAAKRAGFHIKRSVKNIHLLNIEQKSLHDYVSEVDQRSEQMIREIILESFPDHDFLGEEFGSRRNSRSPYQWIVDPLDGTTNFLRGIPHYSISIALSLDGQIILGIVYDPAKDELFSAQDGQGAHCNSKPITVSDRASMQGGLFATGVPFNGQTLANLECFQSCLQQILLQETAGIRRLGSAALDLAYVAAGRYEGYWEANLNQWDIAAGALLVQEAGGVVSDLSGGADMLSNGNILAACPGSFESMLQISSIAYKDWQTAQKKEPSEDDGSRFSKI